MWALSRLARHKDNVARGNKRGVGVGMFKIQASSVCCATAKRLIEFPTRFVLRGEVILILIMSFSILYIIYFYIYIYIIYYSINYRLNTLSLCLSYCFKIYLTFSANPFFYNYIKVFFSLSNLQFNLLWQNNSYSLRFHSLYFLLCYSSLSYSLSLHL